MENNSLLQIASLGQSLWLDYIHRRVIEDGTLKEFILEDAVSGLTSNPAIFEKAVSKHNDYDAEIRQCGKSGMSPKEIYETIALEDVRRAAQLFRPVYDSTNGRDGFVSLEVSPHLADDTAATITEARRLWQDLNSPNVMIKVPATTAGLPAVTQLIREGVNINITLIFSVPRYLEVTKAWLQGLEARATDGNDLKTVASVASFFMSRIDTLVDKTLDQVATAAAARKSAESLRGTTAVASAAIAYTHFNDMMNDPQWKNLEKRGAVPQRLLWASTSTKDAAYSDVKYVEALIAPKTVNTLPLKTLEAYRDHGQPAVRLTPDSGDARATFAQLEKIGIDMADIARQLEQEGIRKFIDPFDKLLNTLEHRSHELTL